MPKYRRGRRLKVQLRESAATAERVEVREATSAQPTSSGRMLIQLLDEGWGSSGGYPAAVLREAARSRVFHKGLPVFGNHASLSEEEDRPERSVHDLIARLTEDARYDEDKRALVAEAQVFRHWREVFCDPDYSSAIGMSIRASGLAEHGEFNGRSGMVITEIKSAMSVDFVTQAGRGGKVLALLESARTRLSETPAGQVRAAIERALKDAYGGPDIYVWLREYDPDRGLVWFEIGAGAVETCWEQGYAASGADVALLGPRRQVVAETVYRPVVAESPADYMPAAEPTPMAYVESACRCEHPDPATTDPGGTPPAETTTTEEEAGMSATQTGSTPAPAGTNTPVSTLTEADASRITSERDSALREAADTKRDLARYRALDAARPIVAAVLTESGLPVPAQSRVSTALLADVPLTESGALDEARLRERATAEATAEKAYLAQFAESNGEGRVSGFGATSAPPAAASNVAAWAAPEPQLNTDLVESYKRRGLNSAAAEAAARGRAL